MSEREQIKAALRGCLAHQAGAAFGVPITGREQHEDALADALAPLIREAEARGAAAVVERAAEDFRTAAASAWGGNAAWLTTGSHVANLAAEWLTEFAEEDAALATPEEQP